MANATYNKAQPFVPTEIHVSTAEDEKGLLGILSLQSEEASASSSAT